jgi:hypothetical protein
MPAISYSVCTHETFGRSRRKPEAHDRTWNVTRPAVTAQAGCITKPHATMTGDRHHSMHICCVLFCTPTARLRGGRSTRVPRRIRKLLGEMPCVRDGVAGSEAAGRARHSPSSESSSIGAAKETHFLDRRWEQLEHFVAGRNGCGLRAGRATGAGVTGTRGTAWWPLVT